MQYTIPLIGRVLLSLVFIYSGISKIQAFSDVSQKMYEAGMTLGTDIFLAGAIAFLLLGGVSLILGFKTRLGAFLLVCFLVPTTIVFHIGPGETGALLKNAGLLGGLLMIMAHGPGAWSIDGHKAGA